MKNKKVIKDRNDIILIIIASILFLLALLINRANVFRLFMVFGVIGISVYLFIKYKKNKSRKDIPIIVSLFVLLFIMIDTIIVCLFGRVPIFSYDIIDNQNTRVYTSLGYRVWQCDKKSYKDLKVEPFYNKGYVCDADSIEPMDINSFIDLALENYDEYRNSFIKITGRISRKNSNSSIEMQKYKEAEDENGNMNVSYDTNTTLKILLDKEDDNLANYNVNDQITVIGVIKNMSDNNIFMYESKLSSVNGSNAFSIRVRRDQNCEKKLLFSDDDNKYYSWCLSEAKLSFNNSQEKDLDIALKNGDVFFQDLYNGKDSADLNDTDNSLIYRNENYALLICDHNYSDDVIIGPKDMYFDSVKCDMK